jgi:hypothetical protein
VHTEVHHVRPVHATSKPVYLVLLLADESAAYIMHSTVRVLGDGLPRVVGGVEEAIAIEFGAKQLQLSLVWDDGDAQLAPLFSGNIK